MKKILSLALATLMIVGVLCGCGGGSAANFKDTKGHVKLVWAIPTSEQSDYDMVIKEVNKLIAKKLPDTELELLQDSSMGSKWSLWMAGKKAIDIACSGYVNDLATEINKKSYIELNNLVKDYAPTIEKEWKAYETDYLTGMVDGKLYALPDLQIHINDESMLNIPDYYYQYLDVAALQAAVKENSTSTQVFYDIFNAYLDKASKDKKPDNAGLISGIDHMFRCFAKRGYEFVGGKNSLVCYKLGDKKCKIVNFAETEEYMLFIKNAADWYAKGYISKDILTGEEGIGDKRALMAINITNFRLADDNKDGIITPEEHKANNDSTDNNYTISLTEEDQKYVGSAVLGSLSVYISIPTTSKNPVRAIKLLDLLRSEDGKDIINMLVYGIEGTHYEKTGDNAIKAFDYNGQASSSNKYGLCNWMMGSMLNMYVCFPYSQKTFDAAMNYYNEERPNFKKTPLYGYSFSNTSIENELQQMQAVNEEYKLQLVGGVKTTNYMTTYKEMMKKLEAAGMAKVIKEYQAQADKFIK